MGRDRVNRRRRKGNGGWVSRRRGKGYGGLLEVVTERVKEKGKGGCWPMTGEDKKMKEKGLQLLALRELAAAALKRRKD